MLGFWALTTVLVTLVGTRIGQSVRVVERWDDIDPARLLTWLTLIATVGVIYSMYLAFSAVPVLDALLQRSGNAVSDAIPEAAGLQTLRYAATASAAVAVNELVNKRGRWPLVVWNSLLLGCVVLLQSRLSLVLSGFILLYLNRARIRGGLGRLTAIVLSAVLFMFAVTVPANYVRNGNYYEARGVSNPLAMNASQIVAYLGTPTQVAVGMADALYRLDYQPADPHPGDPLIPTYLLPDREQTYVGGSSRYAPDTDVQSNFTTNSVLSDTVRQHGALGLLTALLGAFAAALLVGHFSRYQGYLAAVAAVLLYGFAEWWRVYLFNAGVFHFVVIALFLSAAASRNRRRSSPDTRTPDIAVE